MAMVIQLAAYYGLRRSKVLGIRWNAIDFQRGTISINHKVTEGKAGGQKVIYTEDKLKTKSTGIGKGHQCCLWQTYGDIKSKRKAKWLLENGVIPCEDSGKQTHRFQVRLSDVADFLQRMLSVLFGAAGNSCRI